MSASWRAPVAVLALAITGAGCGHLPAPPPVVPPPGSKRAFGLSFGHQYAPATAVLRSPSTGEVTLHESWEDDVLPGLWTLFDPRVQATWALAERHYLGAHLGVRNLGLALHYVPIPPLVLTLGGHSDTGLFSAFPGMALDAEAGVLVQPTFAGRVQLMAGAGLSYGRRGRSMQAKQPIGNLGLDQIYPTELRILRRELRADLVAGVAVIFPHRIKALLAVQPFFLLGDPGAPEAACSTNDTCVPDVTLVSYSSSWGMAFTASFMTWE